MSKWPEAAVAVALILLIAAVSVAGIARYQVDEFMKIWAALTGLVGIITGAVVTYFFTRSSLDQAERKVAAAERKLEVEREHSRALLIGGRSVQLREPSAQETRREEQYREWVASGDQRRLN
jgi:hypothetical protein